MSDIDLDFVYSHSHIIFQFLSQSVDLVASQKSVFYYHECSACCGIDEVFED